MRAVETMLAITNAIAFLVLVIRLPDGARWLRHAALVPLVVTGAHLLIEGPRWQMVPAYALAGLWGLVWVRQAFGTAREPGRRRQVATSVGVALGAVGLVISVALPVLVPVVRFPPPSGQFGIGTLTYHWVDDARPEIFTNDPDDRRELMVQVWYPAEPVSSAPHAPYIEDVDAVAPALTRLLHMPGFVLSHMRYYGTNAIPSAPVAHGERRYPVLILLIGRGGYRQVYTFKVKELVSHGYVVAAVEQPYAHAKVVFPDGRQADYDPRMNDDAFFDSMIPYLAQDAVFTLDQLAGLDQADPFLAGQLDLQRTGLVGQSMGGIAGAEACRLDRRLRACQLEDAYMPAGVVRAGLQQPTMWITRDAETMRLERRKAGGWSEADIDEHLTTMRAVFERLPGPGYYVEVPGMFHVEMTDVALVSPLAPQLGLAGPVGAPRTHRIISAYSVAFFDRHLKGQPAALLDGPTERFSEVRIEAR